MPNFYRTVFLGHDLALFLPDPNWRTAVSIAHRLTSEVELGQTGRENRSPKFTYLRHEMSAAWTLRKEDTAALQSQLYSLGIPVVGDRVFVGMPMFPDKLEPARWGERIYDAKWVINYDETGYTIHAADDLPGVPTRRWFAPLMVGRLEARPKLTPLNQEEVQFKMKLLDRSPWDFRIAPAAQEGVGADWPESLLSNWRQLPEDTTNDILVYEDVGQGRVEALDGQEGVMRRSQGFLATLQGRAQIRTLLNFFLARKGAVQSFDVPWLLQPGDDLPETPHSTKARFGDDVITLDFANDEEADAKIALLQVPWEIEGVDGEQPEQEDTAYFYRLWLDVPGGPVDFLFTNWEHDLVRTEGTYRGDQKSQFRHDQITQSIDLSDDPVTLSSWIFDGNPLVRATQRALSVPLNLEIRRGSSLAPNDAELVYVGRIDTVSDQGRRLTAKTKIFGGMLDVKVPTLPFGNKCKYRFCSAGCTLDPNDWLFAGTIVSQIGNQLTIAVTSNPPAAALVDDYFATGWIKKGTADTYEIRQIVRSEVLGGGQQRLTLKRALQAFAPGDGVTFQPRCGQTMDECDFKYGNFINYGGHPQIGPQNLSVPIRELDTPTGKK